MHVHVPTCPEECPDGTFLEAPETELQQAVRRTGAAIDDDCTLSTTFRHSGWKRDRRLVCEALVRTGRPDSRIKNFCDCGSEAYVLRSVEDPNIYRLAGSACHDRFCLPCANERSHAIKLNVLEQIAGKQVRFLTLTVRSTTEPLAELVDKLYSAFQALRRRALWKKCVDGGVAFLEVKWVVKTQRWHPHFHLLIEGRFIPYKQLKAAWHEITGDSFIIDISLVRNSGHAGAYVAKYASKPFNNTFLNRPMQLDEAIVAMHGRKLCVTFGTWRGVTLARTFSEGAWEYVCTLETLITYAAHGDIDSNLLLGELTDQDMTPIFSRAPPLPPKPPAKPTPDEQVDWFGVWQHDGTFKFHVDP